MSLIKRNKKNRPKLNSHSKCVVGVTGGIGSGKSHLLLHFKKLGFEVHDTDKISKKLIRKDGAAFHKLSKLFPNAVIESGISISKLRKLAFQDESVFPKLGEILHPLIRKFQQDIIDNAKRSIIFEVPLLFENQREDYYDYIIAAVAPVDIQKKRVLERKGMTKAKLDVIMAKQTDNNVRAKKADFVIDTSESHNKTFAQLRKIIDE